MDAQQILMNNKLIAEFMDWKTEHEEYKSFTMLGGNLGALQMLKYHSSWDWLMPVVDKIEGFGLEFQIEGCYARVFDHPKEIITCHSHNKIGATVKAVVKFIEQLNERNKDINLDKKAEPKIK